jgi:hypothetical protein
MMTWLICFFFVFTVTTRNRAIAYQLKVGNSFLFQQEFIDHMRLARNYSTRPKLTWSDTLRNFEQQQITYRKAKPENCYLHPAFCAQNFQVEIIPGASRTYVLPPNEQSLTANVLRTRGEYEELIISVIIDLLQLADLHTENGHILFDIGAEVGAWTLGLADRFEDKRTVIHSFEVFEEYLQTMDLAIKLNQFQNTSFIFHHGLVANLIDHSSGILPLSRERPFHSVTQPMSAPLLRLDHLLATEQIPCPTFIRFNIDFEEFQALLGSEYLLYHCHPIVVVSVPCRSLTLSYVKFFERVGYYLGWMLSIPCLDCHQFEWFQTAESLHDPYLIAIPVDQPYLFHHPMIAGIPMEEYFDNNIYRDDRGKVEADQVPLSVTFPNGYDVKAKYRTNSSRRCLDWFSLNAVNYYFQTVEGNENIHDSLQHKAVIASEGDPLEEKYARLSSPGIVKFISSIQDYHEKEIPEDISRFNMNDFNRIRFVSAFYNIKRDQWVNGSYRRSNDRYFIYFQSLLMLDIDLVLFLDETLEAVLLETILEVQSKNRFRCKLRVIFINEEFLLEYIHAFQFLSLEREIGQSETFRNSSMYQIAACKECLHGDYTTMVHSKIDFVYLAIEYLFPKDKQESAEYVYSWVDFGLFKRFDEIPSRPLNVSRIRQNGKRIMVNAVVPVWAYTVEEKIPFLNGDILQRDSIITCLLFGKFKFLVSL